MISIKFWGVRGSIPSPLSNKELHTKYGNVIKQARIHPEMDAEAIIASLPIWQQITYGGNTTCVSIEVGNTIICLDAGTGIRNFGNYLMPKMAVQKEVKVELFLSHVHWDHIQGIPFFAPLYIHKNIAKSALHFHGGSLWQRSLETCLQGQMDPPMFPVNFAEIGQLIDELTFESVYHMKQMLIGNEHVKVITGKLNHPNETYGYRFEVDGKIIAFTTDNEPFDPLHPDPRLLSLIKDADYWITDCQYFEHEYHGMGGIPKLGWGHSYPRAVVTAAKMAKVKQIVLTHLDPAHNDSAVYEVEQEATGLIGLDDIGCQTAWEGLEINL